MTGFWIFLLLIVILAVGVVLYTIGGYNSLVRMRNLVEESWRQVDVELNRRYDLIPNLVETVKDVDTWVLDPVPGKTNVKPTRALITLTTCQDLFHSPDRSVGFGHLVGTTKR